MEILEVALSYGVVPAIVLGLYLIINKIIDNKKELARSKFNNDLMSSVLTINSFVYTIMNNYINKNYERCELAAIHNTEVSAFHISKFIIDTIYSNKLEENKKNISDSINTLINKEYNRMYSSLSLYEMNSVKLSAYMDKKWIGELKDLVKDTIFSNEEDKVEKILRAIRRINIKFQDISSYISTNCKSTK